MEEKEAVRAVYSAKTSPEAVRTLSVATSVLAVRRARTRNSSVFVMSTEPSSEVTSTRVVFPWEQAYSTKTEVSE